MQAKRVAKVVSLSFQPEIFNKINEYCAERGCSRSWFMNKAAELYLAECLEDKADYETAAEAWAQFEKKQLTKLDNSAKRRILDYMDDVARLKNPRERGKMLIGNMPGLWRYRVGDYRILCKIRDEELVVTVVGVGHRREVYE